MILDFQRGDFGPQFGNARVEFLRRDVLAVFGGFGGWR